MCIPHSLSSYVWSKSKSQAANSLQTQLSKLILVSDCHCHQQIQSWHYCGAYRHVSCFCHFSRTNYIETYAISLRTQRDDSKLAFLEHISVYIKGYQAHCLGAKILHCKTSLIQSVLIKIKINENLLLMHYSPRHIFAHKYITTWKHPHVD